MSDSSDWSAHRTYSARDMSNGTPTNHADKVDSAGRMLRTPGRLGISRSSDAAGFKSYAMERLLNGQGDGCEPEEEEDPMLLWDQVALAQGYYMA